jgi:hypothetical protein
LPSPLLSNRCVPPPPPPFYLYLQIWSPADSIYNEEDEEEAIGSGAGPRDEDLEA